MVKLEVQFHLTDIQEIRLLDSTNLNEWSIVLLPLRQTIFLDFTWMHQESVARIKNFETKQLVWHKNLIPYLILDSIDKVDDTKYQYEHKLNVLDGKNHVCIYDIHQQRLRILPSRLSLEIQQLKFTRYLAIAYHKMCHNLRMEHMQRSILENQRSALESQKLIAETVNELVARSFSQVSMARSPTIRRPVFSKNIWELPNNDEKESVDKALNQGLRSPILYAHSRSTSSPMILLPNFNT